MVYIYTIEYIMEEKKLNIGNIQVRFVNGAHLTLSEGAAF